MLLQATIRGFGVFRGSLSTTLSMLADPKIPHDARHVMRSVRGRDVLRVAALYGDNGAGKSTFFRALTSFGRLVVQGATTVEAGFARATSVKVEVEAHGQSFSYGVFVVGAEQRVTNEYLYRVGSDGHDVMMFDRRYDDEEMTHVTLGDMLATGDVLREIAKQTPLHTSYLAKLIQARVPGIDVVATAMGWQTVEDTVPDARGHSLGVHRMNLIEPLLASCTAEGGVALVDDLDRGLHPLNTRRIVQTFLEADRGQTIFSTHDTRLMDIVPRDAVWFVERASRGAHLYSLSDMHHDDVEALAAQRHGIEAGYLQGRFGAVP